MIIRTNKADKERYFESPALNQSSLKKLLIGVDAFVEEDRSDTSYFTIGSAVDTILTGYEGQFEEEFYVSNVKKPSETIEQMLLSIYENSLDKKASLDSQINLIEEVITQYNYQPKWKMETKVGKILEQSLYYEELQNMEGKKVLGPDEKNLVDTIVDELRNTSLTAPYFSETTPHNTDIYYQLPLYWKDKNIECKGLLDIVVVTKDEDNNVENIHIIDIKTTSGKTTQFSSSFRKFRYDIQAGWYMIGINSAENLPFTFDKDTTTLSFSFIVASTTFPILPLMFDLPGEVLEIAYKGRPDIFVDGVSVRNEIKGIGELLTLYRYYEKNGWDLDMSVRESKGRFVLTWDTPLYQTIGKDGATVWKKI